MTTPGLSARPRPFAYPEFYLPWPARENPHRDAARERDRAWAEAMGMHGEGVWDGARFDAFDVAGAAAYCFPDAPAPMLALLADWGNWAFYLDDMLLERFKRGHDAQGARDYVDQTAAIIGIDPPEPADAAQRALADLWARTAPLMSEHWRRRFADRTVDQLREAIWELENIGSGRVPNPVEYLHRRRGTAGGAWMGDLVELANGAELRPDLVDARALRVLRDCFGDTFMLRNDIFSYQREIEEEGEVNNSVLVLEHFLDLDPQRAANTVNDLSTSRMQQFENTLLTEIPLLLEESLVGPADRLAVLAYAKGLQDFQAGLHRWMEESPRYGVVVGPAIPAPRGLGTAAERLWASLRPVERGPQVRTVPELRSPYPARVNAHLGEVRPQVKDWARQVGMLAEGVWDEARYDRVDLASWVAHTHPEIDARRLAAVAKWYLWGFYLDDVLDKGFQPRRDYLGAKAYLSRIPAFLPPDGVSSPLPANAVERALKDLWPVTFAEMRPELREAFPADLQENQEAALWELANAAQGRVPDSVDYLEMRRITQGRGFTTDLLRFVLDTEPGELTELESAFADIGAWENDVLSYRREIEQEGTVNNGVLVLERLFGCEPDQAMDIAKDLITTRQRDFEKLAATVPESAMRYVDALRAWLGGDLAWLKHAKRHQTEPPHDDGAGGNAMTALGFTGLLGTAAARVFAEVAR